MSRAPATADPAAPDAPASAAPGLDPAVISRQLAMLGRLAEAGLEIAVGLEGEAQEARAAKGASASAGARLAEIALAYARVSRGVRLAIVLQTQLMTDPEGVGRTGGGRAAPAAADPEDEAVSYVVRWLDPERPERPEPSERADAGERGERPDRLDVSAADLARPVEESLDLIRRDLGLPSGWPEPDLRSGRGPASQPSASQPPVPQPPEPEPLRRVAGDGPWASSRASSASSMGSSGALWRPDSS